MSEKYIGCSLSLEVGGGLGFYQGKVKGVNSEKQSITLTKVIHNGKPSSAPEVTISATDILSLTLLTNKEGKKITENQPSRSETDEDNVQPEVEQVQVEANIQIEPKQIEDNVQIKAKQVEAKFQMESEKYEDWVQPEVRQYHRPNESSPIGFQPFRSEKKSTPTNKIFGRKGIPFVDKFAHGNHTSPRPIPEQFAGGQNHEMNGSRRGNNCSRGLPRKQRFQKQTQNWVNDRNDTTFGTQIDEDDFDTEFDFEKNLALFDKEAVMNEISSGKPDVVKQTDRKFRCDENVLKVKAKRKQIIVPAAAAGDAVYTTDNGLLVPSITEELRINLLSNANQHGLTTSRQLEMIGRGATEVIISAIGGSHRLEPGNSNQTPIVVVVCGAHKQGASGANCARQLESQGVRTFILTPPTCTTSPVCMLLQQELQIYALTEGKTVTSIQDLPLTVDLIVDTRYDLHGDLGVRAPAWLSNISTWASSCRAPVVAIDPPSDLTRVQYSIQTRLKLCSVLPLTHLPEKGKLYLLNINIPVQVFTEFEIKYFSPFGANMTIPLHPCQ